VLDVIEKPEVAQALRQDKNQNLQYLKDNYGVGIVFCSSCAAI
jgi:translation initiation factor 3 subunit E